MRPYAPDSIWNAPLSKLHLHVDPNSAALVAQFRADKIGQGFNADDPWSHPVYEASAGDTGYRVIFTEDWGPTNLEGETMLIPPYAKPERGTDAHIAVIQPDGWEMDVYKTSQIGNGTITGRFGGKTRIDGDSLGAKATAHGAGLAAGNITGEELAAGAIEHALFAVVAHTNGQTMNGAWSKAAVATGPYPACGQRFQLRMTKAEIAALGYPDWELTVLRCLKKFGLIVADTGGGLFKAESMLPYVLTGRRPPLLDVKADGRFPVRIPWERMRALV